MTSKAAVAGNYAASGGTGDPEFVADRLDDIQTERAETAEATVDHHATRRELEASDPDEPTDYGTIEVADEEIPIQEPIDEHLGVGHTNKLELLVEGHEPKHVRMSIDAFYEAITAATPEKYDQLFWLDLTGEQLGEAFSQFREQSRGGANAGN